MRLQWSEPTPAKGTDDLPTGCKFPSTFWAEAIEGWLKSEGVFVEFDRVQGSIDYNYVYHFFDITLFEDHDGPVQHRRDRITDMESYLQRSGVDYQVVSSTYRWLNDKQIPGVRYWIYAEKPVAYVRAYPDKK